MNKNLNVVTLLEPINKFLQCETPQSWVDEAIKPENFAALIIDHANCEKKCTVSKQKVDGLFN